MMASIRRARTLTAESGPPGFGRILVRTIGARARVMSAVVSIGCFCALMFIGARPALATNLNFCNVYWTAFDTPCGSDGNQGFGPNRWADFERGINYTRYNDMWVFSDQKFYYAHAGSSTYKACLYFSSQRNTTWSIMPFQPTNATIAGHIDNYGVNEAC